MTGPGPALDAALSSLGLINMGIAPIDPGGTRLLLGTGPRFWDHLRAAPEGQDTAPDPVDRYSTRVIQDLADRFDAQADFPFGGPPYAPFITWALDSGRAWSSPIGMLVHDVAGLMISYRGALSWPDLPCPRPPARPSPCDSCPQPCLSACPVDAFSTDRPYDVPGCHAYLASPAGATCMTQGCLTRLACPISQSFGRYPAQSQHHMHAFHSP